jgi:transposase
MSRSVFWPSDEAWAAIAPHRPQNQPGARRADDWRADDWREISGIIHMLRCGGRWADAPPAQGPPTTVCNRWNRWSRRGIWTRILSALTGEGWIAETARVDGSDVKAHWSAGGAKGALEPRPLASRAAAGRRRSRWASGPSSTSSVARSAAS